MTGSLREQIQNRARGLTESQRRLAGHLLDHLEVWAFESAGHLSARLGLHRSTIVRFAQSLGWAGFPELQAEARRELLKAFSPAGEPNRKKDGLAEQVQQISEREIMNLRQTYLNLDLATLEATARGLAQARRVVVFGRRFSYALAVHLYLALNTMRDRVRLAPEPGGVSVDALFDLTADDYGLVVSLRRYSPEVQRTIAFLGRSGVPHTLLTDIGPLAEAGARVEAEAPASPAPPVLTRVIQAHVGGVSVLDSHTALASLSHALLSAVSWFLPESRKRLEEVERAWHRFHRSPV